MKINYAIIPLITIVVSVTGNLFTNSGLNIWYKTLNLPDFTPPGSLIGLVWTIIFILTTLSALIVWNRANRAKSFGIIVAVFLINAALNVLWSYLFFNQQMILTAFWDAVALGVSVLVLIILIWPASRLASLLLVPYVLWVSFASYLTYTIWTLNM